MRGPIPFVLVAVIAATALLAASEVGQDSGAAEAGSSPPGLWGDVDCSASVDPIDALRILRADAGVNALAAQGAPCPDLGAGVTIGGVSRIWGDGDCSGALNPVDGLKTLRFDAGLSVAKADPTCPDLGSQVTLGSGGVALLNEVMFAPGATDDAFVELKSAGGTVDAGALRLVNEAGAEFAVPSIQLDESGLLLVDVPPGFLDASTGFVELRADDSVMDSVAWGTDYAGTVNLSRGGMMADAPPGSTIGRIPSSTAPGPADWVPYSAEQATPGQPNPHPSVEVTLPLAGALFTDADVRLAWYTVPGAEEYRVQIAEDDSFAAPVVDATTATASVSAGSLPDGDYFWRVQAINDAAAAFSPVSTFAVASGLDLTPGALSTASSEPVIEGELLDVPLIKQHKDTRMVHLHVRDQEGEHAWDVDHGDIDHDDNADNKNCALAALAMINKYYGGNVSQDRIGVFSNRTHPITPPQPEWDLYWNNGTHFLHLRDLYGWAIGPVFYQEGGDGPGSGVLPDSWDFIVDAIDGEVPLIAAAPGHAYVIKGYATADGVRHLLINDPSLGEIAMEFSEELVYALWSPDPEGGPVTPFVQEASIEQDSDGDGLVDFDETVRFKTDPNHADTDRDGLTDKLDLAESLFGADPPFASPFEGRDWDGDGLPMELDCDSDNDGILDGVDTDNFSTPVNGSAAACEVIAWVGETHSTRPLGPGSNETIETFGRDLVFALEPPEENQPKTWTLVSGTVEFIVSGTTSTGCEVEGSLLTTAAENEGYILYLEGLDVYTGLGNPASGELVPVVAHCPDGDFESTRVPGTWFLISNEFRTDDPAVLEGENVLPTGTYEWSFRSGSPSANTTGDEED